MKGFRFYLEFPDARTKKKSGRDHKGHSGNVFAACDTWGNGFRPPMQTRGAETFAMLEGAGAVYFHPNSACAWTSAGVDYLREKCKRIPESKARKIHPALFEYLEQGED